MSERNSLIFRQLKNFAFQGLQGFQHGEKLLRPSRKSSLLSVPKERTNRRALQVALKWIWIATGFPLARLSIFPARRLPRTSSWNLKMRFDCGVMEWSEGGVVESVWIVALCEQRLNGCDVAPGGCVMEVIVGLVHWERHGFETHTDCRPQMTSQKETKETKERLWGEVRRRESVTYAGGVKSSLSMHVTGNA